MTYATAQACPSLRLVLSDGRLTWTVLGRAHRPGGPAEDFLGYLRDEVSPECFGLPRTAGVSLGFLYRKRDIRRGVEQLRDQQRQNPQRPRAERIDPDRPSSVTRTLIGQLTGQG